MIVSTIEDVLRMRKSLIFDWNGDEETSHTMVDIDGERCTLEVRLRSKGKMDVHLDGEKVGVVAGELLSAKCEAERMVLSFCPKAHTPKSIIRR